MKNKLHKLYVIFAILTIALPKMHSFGQATIPAAYSGAFAATSPPTGWTWTVNATADPTLDASGTAARFNTTSHNITINYSSSASSISYYLRSSSTTGSDEVVLEESTDGSTWSEVASHVEPPTSATQFTQSLNTASRYVRLRMAARDNDRIEVDGISITYSASYCSATATSCDEYISRVQVGSIDKNVDDCGNYRDYTSETTNMTIGTGYGITVTNGSGYSTDQCGIWVDWNQDFDFDDANETITVTGTPSAGPYTATITPPVAASTGNTRMRIRVHYDDEATSACGTTVYGEVEDYTINVVAASTSGTSTLSTGAGSEPATISSILNTQGAAVLNFDFSILDDGAIPATNTTATQISQIVFNQGTGNDIGTWSDAILGALLSDGTNSMTGTINAGNITFSSITNTSGQLGYIADNATKTYTLKIWLKTTLGGTLASDIDGQNFVFNVSNSSFTFLVGGLTTAQSVSSSASDNAVVVSATKLIVSAPSSVAANTDFGAIVSATDVNGNTDINSTASVTIARATGTGAISSATGLTLSLVAGTKTWLDLRYNTVEDFTISASAGGLTTGTSSTIHCIQAPGAFSLTAPLSDVASCTGNITISWGASSSATSYDLYYSTGYGSDPSNDIAPTVGVTSPYTFNASSANTLYRFKILAKNAAGQTWSTNIGSDSTRTGYTWKGGTTTWSTGSNWCGGSAPTSSDDVIIPASASSMPTLTANANVKNITIESGATLTTGSYTVNVYGDWLNNGTLSGTGTVNFCHASSNQSLNNGVSGSFYNLTVNKTNGTVTINTNKVTVSNNITITSGTLDANSIDLDIYGNWSNNSVFITGTNTVTFKGSGNSTIAKTGPLSTIYSEGFENGNSGWTMQSIAGNTDFRIQSSTPRTGTYYCGTFNLNSSTANNYCTQATCGNYSLDFFRDIDLTDYSAATITYYYKCSTTGTNPTGQFLMNGANVSGNLQSSSYTQASHSLNSYCGSGTKQMAFRFYMATSGTTQPGLLIDDIVVTATSGTEDFNSVVINKTGGAYVQMNGNVINDNITITAGELKANGKYLKCYGNFTNNGTFTHGDAEVQFLGTTTQYIAGSANTTFYNLTKKSTGDLIIGDAVAATTVAVSNTFYWPNNSDKITVGQGVASVFQIDDDLFILQNCEIETANNATLSVKYNYNDRGTYTPNQGMVKFHGDVNSTIITEPAYSVYNEGFETGAATGWTLGADAGESKWSIQSGAGHSSTYDLAMYDDRWDMTHDYNWSTSQGRIVTIDATSATIDLSSYDVVNLRFWYRIGGDADDYGQVIVKVGSTEHVLTGYDALRYAPVWRNSDIIDISSIAGGQSVVKLIFRFKMNGTTAGVAPGFCVDDIELTSTSEITETFYDLSVDKTSKSAKLMCPIIVKNNMTITTGDFNSSAFSFPVGRNWTNSGTSTFTHNNNTITLNGDNSSKPQSINIGATSFYNLILNNSGGTATLSTNKLVIDNDFTLTAGTLDMNDQDIDIDGNWLNNGGSLTPRLRTVSFLGNDVQSITSRNAASNTFYSIIMNKTGSLILQDSLTLSKDLKLIKGLLDVNTNKNIRIGGDWLVGNGTTRGSFSQGTATVTFNGTTTQNINKTTAGAFNLNDFTFYDVVIDGTDVNLFLKSDQYKLIKNKLTIMPNKSFTVDGAP